MIDQDFEKVAEQINAKVREAAAALKEANRLRQEAGIASLICTQWMREDLWRETRNELKEAGKELDHENIDELMNKKTAVFDLFDVSDLECEIGRAGWSTSSSYC